jgi:hypothetical protein
MMHKPIGEYLVEERKITRDQLMQSLAMQANPVLGRSTPLLGTILVEMGALSQGELARALERQEADRMMPVQAK